MLQFPPDWQLWVLFGMVGFAGLLNVIGMVATQVGNMPLSLKIAHSYFPLLGLIAAWLLLIFGHANGYTLLGLFYR